MDTKGSYRQDTALSEQAAQWLHTLKTGGKPEHAAFAAWLKESPRHIEEALCAAAVDKALDRLNAEHWPDISKYLENPTGIVIPLSEKIPPLPAVRGIRRRRRLWRYGAAAAIASMVGWWAVHGLAGRHHYVTRVGEQRALTLDDGSLAYLNTHSQLDVRFTAATREVLLVEGEALFKVQHDPARPFLVRTDDAVIRAIGTRFNVYRRTADTVVSVTEGVVEIVTARGSSRLTAGEEMRISSGTGERRARADIAKTEAWRQRRLVFDLTPLAEMAAEFNRYNRAPRISVEGDAARGKRFSGVFDADDPASLMNLLETYGDLKVEELGDEIVVRSR